jgi:hypothetical protein
MERAKGTGRYAVEVWFATSSGFVRVTTSNSKDAALIEARAYHSDSRGIQVVDTQTGEITEVK